MVDFPTLGRPITPQLKPMKDVLECVSGVSSNGLGQHEGMEFHEDCQGLLFAVPEWEEVSKCLCEVKKGTRDGGVGTTKKKRGFSCHVAHGSSRA
jgi:hypothetical protein